MNVVCAGAAAAADVEPHYASSSVLHGNSQRWKNARRVQRVLDLEEGYYGVTTK